MNIVLWVLQIAAALLYGASGVMKVFMFDKISGDVPSFGALPRQVWMALGILELVCTVGLIVPAAFRWHPTLTVVAAVVLATESLVFVGVHAKYHEVGSIVMVCALGLLMAFIAPCIRLRPGSWAGSNNNGDNGVRRHEQTCAYRGHPRPQAGHEFRAV